MPSLNRWVMLAAWFFEQGIIYSGGPLYLGDVTFENCQFQFGSGTESQKVLAQIKEMGKQPVTLHPQARAPVPEVVSMLERSQRSWRSCPEP
jgi:hypothetical protein